MSPPNDGLPAELENDDDIERLLGPARLAYFTPVREYPPLSDRKSIILLSLNGLMATVMCLFRDEIHHVIAGDSMVRIPVIAAGIAWSAIVVLGSASAFVALTRPIPPLGDCVAFYRTIAAHTLEGYRGRLDRLSHRDAMRDILTYNHGISLLCVEKFRHIQRSVVCLSVAMPLWMLLMVLFTLRAVHFHVVRLPL